MKRKNKNGFTLAELLIVVAIISVLVAISIPIFTSQLEKAREATDAANIRSQYAEVMSEAITSGGNVNGKTLYGAVQLKQQKDQWQTSNLKENLEGTYRKVVGDYPKAGGTAWVEYKASDDSVILHYADASGSDGSSDSGNTDSGNTGGGSSSGGNTGDSGNTGGGSSSGGNTGDSGSGGNTSGGGTLIDGGDGKSDTDISSLIDSLGKSAKTWPNKPSEGVTEVNSEIGDVYKYNGELYVSAAIQNITFSTYYYDTPDKYGGGQNYIKIRSDASIFTIKDSPDNRNLPNTKFGDLYNDNGSFYISKASGNYVIPFADTDGRWIKIKTN